MIASGDVIVGTVLKKDDLGADRAVFVDRDGTLNFERPDHIKSLDELQIIPGACEQIARFAQGFLYIIVITNQSVVGRGIISEQMLDQINAKLEKEFCARTGRQIDDIFLCYHRPEDSCNCRKPKTELFENASRKYNLKLRDCIFVGDKDTDEESARRIGCSFVHVKTNSIEVLRKISV